MRDFALRTGHCGGDRLAHLGEVEAFFRRRRGGRTTGRGLDVGEADPATARDQDDIREAFALDSMDFVNLVTAIHKRTKINIPESDYNKIFVLKNAVAYLRDALTRV